MTAEDNEEIATDLKLMCKEKGLPETRDIIFNLFV